MAFFNLSYEQIVKMSRGKTKGEADLEPKKMLKERNQIYRIDHHSHKLETLVMVRIQQKNIHE